MGIWLGLGLLFYIFFVRQESPPPELISDANGVNGIELKRSQDGHFYIDGKIQGKRVRFLIDTGASIVSIQQSLALHMGLNCDRIDRKSVV
jgi:aspartyl protease family protein